VTGPESKSLSIVRDEIRWPFDGSELRVGFDRAGTGPTVLLLPALSSISTRGEMRPLLERLAPSFTTIAFDWPGFGEQPKPFIDWQPHLYLAFLAHLLTRVAPAPYATVAAGHAAGYLIRHVAQNAHAAGRCVLLSPTWRGPLPTMMGRHSPRLRTIARAFDRPAVGPLLFRLNVNRFMITMMARGHVYADPGWLTGERMQAKLAAALTPGARHASARFVTGCLDPFSNREDFLNAIRCINDPILALFSNNAPRKSRAEMEALAASAGVTTVRLPAGKLSIYEEFPDESARAILKFIA